jgi:outer membrane protein TolC
MRITTPVSSTTVERRRRLPTAAIAAFLTLLSIPASPLSFDEVLGRIDQTTDVQLAIIQVEEAKSKTRLVGFPGDPSLTLTPGVKAISQEEGYFGEQVDLTGAVSFGLPVGLSELEQEKVSEAHADLVVAQRNLEDVRDKIFLRLFSLYQTAWLAQEELGVLEKEAEAARAIYDITKHRFENGKASLIDLSEEDKDREKAEDLYLQGRLNHRLSWLELAFTAKLSPEVTAVLESPVIEETGVEFPKPPELSAWAYSNHPTTVEQALKIRLISDSVNRLGKLDYALNLKTFFNYQDHAVTLGYVFTSPEMTGSYSFPIHSFGEIPESTGAGSQVETWNMGVTLGLTIATGTNDGLVIEGLRLELQRERERLEFLKRALDLDIRSKYQQWLKAQDSVKQAETNLSFTIENRTIAETKKSLGMIGEEEFLEANALVERARWNLSKAIVDEVRAKMTAADAAAFLSKAYPIEKKMEVK